MPIDIAGAPQFALSPDGSRIIFVAGAPGERQRLWVRRLDASAAQPVGGTDDASTPFWSPDSASVAFFASGRLKKVRVDGGSAVQDLAAASIDVNGGTWNRGGVILFGAGPGDGVFRVSAGGGTAVPETTIDAGRKEVGHRWPQFLPDDRHYLVYIRSSQPGSSGVYLGELGSPNRRLLLESATSAFYRSSGEILYQSATLTKQKVDLDSGQLLGTPESLSDQVSTLTGPSQLPVSASATGRIGYWVGDRVWSALSWVDRTGRQLGVVMPDGLSDSPEISPDGAKLLFSHGEPGRAAPRSIWVHDLATAAQTRLTLAPVAGRFAVWSPDADGAAFSTSGSDGYRISRRSLSGPAEETTILFSDSYWAMMPPPGAVRASCIRPRSPRPAGISASSG